MSRRDVPPVHAPDPPAAQEHFHPFAPGFIDYPPPFDGSPIKSEMREDELLVEDFVLGTGEPVGKGSYVTFHYTGYMDDGYVYDSTRRRHRPYSFSVGAHQALPGWDRGLRGMQVGGQRRLHVPAPLAFGDRGRPQVPPGATIVFTVELLKTQGPFAEPMPLVELRALSDKSTGPELRPAPDPRSRAAAIGDQLFVHFEQRDAQGRAQHNTYRFGVPRLIIVEGPGWTEGLVGLRVGGLRRIHAEETTVLAELMGFGEEFD